MSSSRSHLPEPGRHLPISTYRLQLSADFTFQDALEHLDYWHSLGITDLFLSPILQAAPGSTHGYDVVNHRKISTELGGQAGFEQLADQAHQLGLGIIVDVVPNHMAVPTPVWYNRPMWSVLKRGSQSPYAHWFDVDLDAPILMPILGERIGQVLANQTLELIQMEIPTEPERGKQWVLKYFDHYFPVASGTESLPLGVLVERQHYRLAHWKVADEELNYRRFFDVDSLAAIRVEEPDVFEATHHLLLDLFNRGKIDGFRVDHPDGLADPAGYFDRLSKASNGAWIAGEKILEGGEQLPSDWPIAGTTGYDTAWRLTALQVDPQASLPLGALMQSITGDSPSSYPELEREAKSQIIDTSLAAEIRRIGQLVWDICQDDLRLRDFTFRHLIDCIRTLIIEVPCYRAYVVADQTPPALSREIINAAAERAVAKLDPDLADTMEVIVALALGDEIGSAGLDRLDPRRREFLVRFQQVCGAVMAKGVEDTTFYRWTHLCALNEVGSNPQQFGITVDALHQFAATQQQNWPATMTTATTHDTKRSEDVRIRGAVISQYPHSWAATVDQLQAATSAFRPASLDGRSQNLLWQTLVSTWDDQGPISPTRLVEYLTKAIREQKTWTTWVAPDQTGEKEFLDFATQILEDQPTLEILADWHQLTNQAVVNTILANKALQLTMPGVADNYQGSEITQTSLVDPDNRRPVDFAHLSNLLQHLDQRQGHIGVKAPLDERKLWLTANILRLRRRRPDVFVSGQSSYQVLPISTGYAVAFARGLQGDPQVLTIARRLAGVAQRNGGIPADASVVLPPGNWKDICADKTWTGGTQLLNHLLEARGGIVLEKVD